MPDGNPLVATAQSDTTAVTGIGIAESSVDLANGISNGDWVEAGLGAVGVGLEVLSMVIDPIGTIASYGVSWLIEHVQPLKEALDWFAGDPPVIRSFSETWANVAAEVNKVAGDYNNEIKAGTAAWTGQSADTYRGKGTETADAIAGAGALADGISAGVMIMGEVVAAVRELVRDLVAEIVGKLITWALEAVATLGLGTPVIVAQATAAISKVVNKIADLVRKLVKTIGNVTPRIRKVIDKLDEIIAKLGKLGRKADSPSSPDGFRSPDTTSPSSTTSPSGSTSPSSTTSPSGTTSPDTSSPSSTSPSGDGTSPSSSSPDTSSPSTSTSGTKAKDGADDPRRSGQDEKSTCTNGDPINMFTGEMLLPQTDVDLAGVLPLQLNRKHLSGYRAGRLFGPTWASTLDQRLEVEPDGVYFATEDGRILVYPVPAADGTDVMPVEGARWPLRFDGDQYTITQPETWTTLGFDANSGAITSIAARTGHRIDFAYGADGALTSLAHSGGYRIGVDTVDGLVSRLYLIGPQNILLMRYGYEGRRLTTVTNSSNRSHRFDYDQAGRIIHWEDRNAEWYRFHYDADGRCVRTEGSGDALTGTLDIDHGNRVSVWTNSLGERTTYYFNELNQVAREIDPLGNATLSEWDRYDRLLARTDPLGNITRYQYDPHGNLVTLTRADGTQRSHEYDDENRLLTTVDPNGAVWRREYDPAGNLVAATDPVGATTRYAYDSRAHISTITDPLGAVHFVETNAAGLPTATINPTGAVTRYQRDQFGRVTTITDPLGNVTQYRWTIEGALLSRTLPDGTTEVWRYDGEGNHVEHVDALGQTTRTLTTHFDMPSAVTTPDGGTVTYQYDSELRLTTVTNQLGHMWRYVYDAAGNLVAETDFNGRTLTYEYDAAGQVVTRTNALGEQTHLTWDRVGNLVERRSTEGTARFEYDEASRLLRATNADADVAYKRDAAGRVLTETVNGRTVASTYDKLGRLISRRTPTGAESVWAYDGAGRPAALRTGGRLLTFSHDAAGREIERIFDSGLTISQTWNGNSRLTGQTVLAGAPARFLQQRRYQYRPDDYVTSIDDHIAGTSQYELDAIGRVVGVQSPAGVERYAYDQAGNAEPRDGGVYRYDQQGRLIMRQRKRLSAKPATWRYNWDSDDRLVAVITPDGTQWRYRYDALGRRISKERLDGSGERTDFVWDGDLLAEQLHSSGHTMSWDYAPDAIRPLTQIERSQESIDQQFYGIVTDLIGTPMELVSMAGDIAWRARQSVWGSSEGPGGTPLRFPGQYYDAETGLHYNHHRYYVPELAAYASVDPLGLLPSPNPRAYVPNPMSWLDPLGLAACRDCNARREDLPKGDNRWFGSRREAFNAARDRIGVPRSQQPVRQWTVGADPSMQGRPNYHYDPAPGSHGRYYEYDTPNGPRVIAEHNADPRAPHPHFHAYQPKDGANGIVIGDKYARVDGPHHFYHSGHEPNWTP